ncbi:Uncharacterised protein [Mycobacteroides abscessus subsp. abscessus]|nr:Uncharacterised protein [Mycobacteroides abscessus subsp. abscessus]
MDEPVLLRGRQRVHPGAGMGEDVGVLAHGLRPSAQQRRIGLERRQPARGHVLDAHEVGPGGDLEGLLQRTPHRRHLGEGEHGEVRLRPQPLLQGDPEAAVVADHPHRSVPVPHLQRPQRLRVRGRMRRGGGREPKHALVVLLGEDGDDETLASGPGGAGDLVEAQIPPLTQLMGHEVEGCDPGVGARGADDVARRPVEDGRDPHVPAFGDSGPAS